MSGSWANKSVFATFWNNASYKSFGKNHFQESDVEETNELPLSNYPTRPSSDQPSSILRPDKRVPSSKLTVHQFLYLAGSHGIGAMILSGGINFAVAYGEFNFGTLSRGQSPMPKETIHRRGKKKQKTFHVRIMNLPRSECQRNKRTRKRKSRKVAKSASNENQRSCWELIARSTHITRDSYRLTIPSNVHQNRRSSPFIRASKHPRRRLRSDGHHADHNYLAR